jgi:hypothetical protein
MSKEMENIYTVVDFVPPPYGTVFKVFLKVFDFAHNFGKMDPLEVAVARLQKQIDDIFEELKGLNQRVNDLALEVVKIQNERHIDKLLEVNREAARIAFHVNQRPTDTLERARLANDAKILADRFLQEPDIWQWTDVRVRRAFDEQDHLAGEIQVDPFPPDFKAHLALPSYTSAILLLLSAIELDVMGEPATVRQRYGEVLERHIAQVEIRPGWDDHADQPETLPEMIRARITCRPYAAHTYAIQGQCLIGIVCENVMERRSDVVRDVTLTLDGPGSVACTAPENIGLFDEREIEDQKGVALLAELGQLMRRILAAGSLREQYIGLFVDGPAVPTLPLAVLYGISFDGGVDWYRQNAAGAGSAANWLGPKRTREGWGSDYIKFFPAGGNSFYGLRSDGVLQWFQHDDFNDGGTGWQGPRDVGTGWHGFRSITPGGDGVLYAVQPDGTLLWYRHDGVTNGGGLETWRGGTIVNSGFQDYQRILSVNAGILYAVANDGRLLWFKHKGFKDGTPAWDGPVAVGTGWQNFRDVFGADQGVIYAEQTNGTLLRYVHNGWATGGGMETWEQPVRVGFALGGYRQMIALMSREARGPN